MNKATLKIIRNAHKEKIFEDEQEQEPENEIIEVKKTDVVQRSKGKNFMDELRQSKTLSVGFSDTIDDIDAFCAELN